MGKSSGAWNGESPLYEAGPVLAEHPRQRDLGPYVYESGRASRVVVSALIVPYRGGGLLGPGLSDRWSGSPGSIRKRCGPAEPDSASTPPGQQLSRSPGPPENLGI